MKASDIGDAEVLAAIRACRGRWNVPRWASWFDVRDHMAAWPWKVVRAKLKSMVRRRVVDGCMCGCRGDLEIIGEEV